MSQDNRSLPEGAGSQTHSPTSNSDAGSSVGSRPTFTTSSSSQRDVQFDEHESGYRSSGRAVVLASREQSGPSAAVVAGAALAGAIAGAAIPFMFAGRSSSTRSSGRSEDTRAVESVSINKPARELYDFWRDFTNLPQFMDNIESVQKLGDKRSHWKIKAPAGTSVEFDSFVTEDVPGRLIAWQSEEGASVPNRGRVEFIEAGGSTTVRVTIDYDPPAGTVGRIAAKLFHREPSVQAREDLRRLKQLMESGSGA
jgi:uncharacterized membrane protein